MRLRTALRVASLLLAAAGVAGAHLPVHGATLSRLAASSPTIVVGRVESALAAKQGRIEVRLAVERAIRGSAPPEGLRFTTRTHHPPAYRVGERVVIFLSGSGPPWRSVQTEQEKLVLPDAKEEAAGLVSAIAAYAALEGSAPEAQRELAVSSLALLGSKSARVRADALYDLQGLLAGGAPFDAADLERLAGVALDAEVDSVTRAGAVSLLGSARTADPLPLLEKLLGAATEPRIRLAAVNALAARRDPRAVPVLERALGDREPYVSAAARGALEALRP